MGKIEIEIAVKSSADQIWGAIKDAPILFPKICPDLYKSAEILEGDGKTAGSVVVFKYVEGGPATFSKDKIHEVNEATKSLTIVALEGEVTALYKTFKACFHVVPKGNGSCVKWSLEYEKAHEGAQEPEFAKEFTVKTVQALDAYILKA